jgi:hypothetical protein
MSLTYAELESITNDYFLSGEAQDIYFNDSFLLNYFLKQKKGLYRVINGGKQIRVPLMYDGQEAGFYSRGDSLSSDDKEAVNTAIFTLKHAFANATIYRIDGLENMGDYAKVELVTSRTAGAQKSLMHTLAGSLYDAPGGSSNRLTGLRSLCNETATTAYGGIAEDDLVASNGTKPWEGKMVSTPTAVSLSLITTIRRLAKVNDGPQGKPNLITTTEAIFEDFLNILQAQQRLTEGKETAKAGFTGLYYAGADVFPDDFCPASHVFGLNTSHVGMAVHKSGNFVRLPWAYIPDSADDKTMKILVDLNLICNNRKAHQGYSNVS